MPENSPIQVQEKINEYDSNFNYKSSEAAIILAAGHGKRIKSNKSKMLHSIYGAPTVERVHNACVNGIDGINSVIVVGIKATDVINVIGKRKNTLFAFQENQMGTGHAVQVALEKIDSKKFSGTVYVLPGDMGLLNKETMSYFKQKFSESKTDMMVLTGIYEGPVEDNSYGRIVRVKDVDADGKPSGEDFGKVIEIIEHKDILALDEKDFYALEYNNRKYSYTKKELVENREFNSGVYAFDYKKLIELVFKLESDNAQNEIYITDLISAFNQKGYSVSAISPQTQDVVMGFNDKSVLKQMEQIYRDKIHEKIKNIIEIDDAEDFFIHEEVIEQILEMDRVKSPLDIKIGKGVHIGKGVKLNYNNEFKKNVFVEGNVIFGQNVEVSQNVHLSTYPNQIFKIGSNVKILWGDIIKGNIEIGEGSQIESSVNMTGSDEFPLRIGKNVLIKGTSYLFGSIIEDDVHIEHSVLIKKRVHRLLNKKGEVQAVRFYLPQPSGIDALENL